MFALCSVCRSKIIIVLRLVLRAGDSKAYWCIAVDMPVALDSQISCNQASEVYADFMQYGSFFGDSSHAFLIHF